MRIILLIVAVIAIGMALDWVRQAQQEETRRIAETPHKDNYILGNLERGKADAAKISLHNYKQAFMLFRINKGTNPPSIQALIDENYLPAGSEKDPFGQLFELKYVGREAMITSPGADHVRGTPDDLIERFAVD